METYNFSDELIAHLAKATQLAILTGTDIVDHFRMIQVECKEGKLYPSEDFAKNFEAGLGRLQQELETKTTSLTNTSDQLPLDFSGA